MNQDYALKTVRASAILTNSYVAGTVIGPVYDQNQLVVLISLTFAALTDARVKVEFSPDGSTYYQESFQALSGTTDTVSLGEHKMAASGNYRIAIPIKDKFIKISALGTGTLTACAMSIDAVIGIQ
jgi:hypothetical protein